jgi:hypothetical protein
MSARVMPAPLLWLSGSRWGGNWSLPGGDTLAEAIPAVAGGTGLRKHPLAMGESDGAMRRLGILRRVEFQLGFTIQDLQLAN